MLDPDPLSADGALIDKTAGARLRLSFPAPLEAQFEAETGRARCRRFVWTGAIALLLFDLFLFVDNQIVPDLMPVAFALRLGIVTPIGLLMMVAMWREPRPWMRETIEVVATIVAAGAGALLMDLSGAPYRSAMHHGILLCVLFATVVQQLRFPYALAACLSCFAILVTSLLALGNFPPQLTLAESMIFASAMLLALMAAYVIERAERRTFLASLRERQLNRELAELSLHDPLTGLGNRRALDRALRQMEQGGTGPAPLSVLLLDIDWFKLFNDSAGHQAGDTCLRRIAALLRAELRDYDDAIFRYGGEEFLILLQRLDLPGAITIAERIRRSIEDAAIPHPAAPTAQGIVTISAGVASATLGAGLRADEIIAGADAALYAAKRAGRNQVWPPFLKAGRQDASQPVVKLRRQGSTPRRLS